MRSPRSLLPIIALLLFLFFRFTRLVCYQSFPDAALPDELKSSNPLGIMRMVDGERTRKPSA